MPIQAVTFDFHNTLARCDAWFALEVREVVPHVLLWHTAETGQVYDADLPARAVELYRAIRLAVMDHGDEIDALDCTMLVLGDLGLTIPRDTVNAGIHAVMQSAMIGCEPMPGVVEAVHALANAGIPLGVVSSAVFHPFLEWSLAAFGILDRFDSVVTSASAGFYKSRTEIYSHALDTLGSVPSEAVHVGDSYRYDVLTAGKLGIGTVWFRETGRDDTGDEADLVVETLEGVAPRIMAHFGNAR